MDDQQPLDTAHRTTGRFDRRTVLRGGALLGLVGVSGTLPQLAGNAWAGQGSAPGRSATAALDVVGALESNLLPNPGFEDVVNGVPTKWSPFNAGSMPYIATSAEQVHSGTASVRLTDPATNVGPGLRSARVLITAGVSYEASAYSYNVSGASQFLLEFWDNKGNRVAVVVGDNNVVGSWQQLRVLGTAPATATQASALLYLTTQNVGTAYFDDASLAPARWLVDAWGGDFLVRSTDTDRLTLRVGTRNDPAAFDQLTVFGTTLTFSSANQLSGPNGERAQWEGSRGLGWAAAHKMVTLAAGTPGTLTVSGIRFTPPAGKAFGSMTLHETNGQREVPVWFAIGGYSTPDHAAERVGAPAALAAARRASDYLETRRAPDGSVRCAHSTWPGDLQPDPQGNASVASGNLRLWKVTDESVHRDRAIRTLDWLVAAQKPSGGFGFPWAWGGSKGHFGYPGHYPENGSYHPAGIEYGIITSNAAQALLEGYQLLGDQAYLDATLRAVDYMLHSRNGFQWLDDAHTTGSVPYCTMDPVDDQGGRTTNIYNIDGSTLQLFAELYPITGAKELRVHGDAMATNLVNHLEPNSSIPYAWYDPRTCRPDTPGSSTRGWSDGELCAARTNGCDGPPKE